MKNRKKSIFSILGLSFLFITGFSTSGMAALWPGDGGSTPPPDPPVLFQPTSPDYDGIIDLHWSEPSGLYPIQSYKVYISDSENGNYDSIATTTSRSYTDTRTLGTWWYYVKAYDGHLTSDQSNKVSVEVQEYPQDYLPWGVDHIDADLVWNGEELLNPGDIDVIPGRPAGESIKVCILDTGIDTDHLDLQANYKGGYDKIGGDNDPEDTHGHGTRVAGIIAAIDGYGGIIGVAPKVDLYVYRLSSGGDIYPANIINGLIWARDHNMDIISMSFGYYGPCYIWDGLIDSQLYFCYLKGIIMVAAAGDGNKDMKFVVPACSDYTIAVGAVDWSSLPNTHYPRCSFSNYGQQLDVVAPGEDIYSTDLNNGYVSGLCGTSYSCAHVTGVIALLLSANTTLYNLYGRDRVDQVKSILYQSARYTNSPDDDPKGWDQYYGHGLVNAYDAIFT